MSKSCVVVSTMVCHDWVFRVAGTVNVRDVCTDVAISSTHAILIFGSHKLCEMGWIVTFGVFGWRNSVDHISMGFCAFFNLR